MLKKCLILAALACMLGSLLPAYADSGSASVFCGDLSAADCQMLRDNAEVMDDVGSFAMDFSMSLDADLEDEMTLASAGSVEVEFNAGVLTEINDLSANLAAADLGMLAELLLTSTKANIWLEASIAIGADSEDLEMSLRLKDGVLLLGAEAMGALTGEDMPGMAGFGLDLNGALADLLVDFGALPEHDKSGMEAADTGAASITRLPDSQVGGVAVAVYETAIDVDALFAQVSAEGIVAASSGLKDSAAVESMMDAVSVDELTMRVYIGLDDAYTYRMEMAMQVAIADDASAFGSGGAISMSADILFSDFNQPVDVEIPEDAVIFPLAMMLAMNEQ